MIKIKAPRYHDNVVLLARYRLACGQDATVEIQTGSYKGVYKVKNSDICNSPLEGMKTRQGKIIQMRAVPLDKLERVGDVA